ncbi:MAG TPA: DNA polymerase III subunit gamma/tau [Sulfurimonas autotrophica]|nr:DNA polymerase III subunit gamma/tau [Sulfurimonas autotrophica]
MSQTLALKYRPKRFEDLIGQDSISQTLAQALDQNRLGHAYLFSGLRGSGKTSTARIFSKALLCEKGPTSKPCDVCEQCQMANEGRHIDIIEMDAASSRKIDDIRDLIEHTKYKPSVGRFKIFIIDEVHMLTKEAFNALLKTLEEPPEFVKFILATTDPLKLPATILSRTQHFRFKKIAKPLIIKHLEHILNIENIAYEPEALTILARSGSGSLRDTLTLLDQAIVYSKSHVDVATVTQMLGIVDPEFLENLFDAVLQKDEKRIREYLIDLENYEAEMVIDEMSLFLKDKLLQNDPKFSPIILERFYRILADTKPLLALNTDGDFVLSLTLFKLIEAMNIKQIDEMIEELEKELSTPSNVQHPTPKIKNRASNIQHTTSTPLQPDNSTLFKNLIKLIYDRNYELGKAFDESIEFVDFKDGVLSWKSNAEGKNRGLLKNNFGVVRHLVQEVFGIGTKISLLKSDNPPKQKVEEPTPIKSEPTEEKIQSENQDGNGATDTSGMVEDVDVNNASCVTGNCSAEEPSKEIDVKDILNDPMVKKAQELFAAKKIIIRSKI